MRKLAFVVLAACGGAAHPTPPPGNTGTAETLHLTYRPLAVGDRMQKVEHEVSDFVIAGTGDVHTEKQFDSTTEALAVAAGEVTSERVTYTTWTESTRTGGQDHPTPTPAAGKTYVVTVSGGQLLVTGDGGAAISEDERAAVAKEEKDLLSPHKMEKFLESQRIELGKPVDVPGSVMGNLSPEETGHMTLTYRGMDGGLARFEGAATLDGKARNGITIDAQLAGTIWVNPEDSTQGRMNLTGTSNLGGSVSGRGTMTIELSTTRLR